MSAAKNLVQIVGRVGVTPEIITFENGVKRATFNVVVTTEVTEEHGSKRKDVYNRVVAWGRKVDLIEKYLIKGTVVAIEGKLVNRVFTDNDGEVKKVTEIQMDEILILQGKKVS